MNKEKGKKKKGTIMTGKDEAGEKNYEEWGVMEMKNGRKKRMSPWRRRMAE